MKYTLDQWEADQERLSGGPNDLYDTPKPDPVYIEDLKLGGWGGIREVSTGRIVAMLDKNFSHPDIVRGFQDTFRGEVLG